MVRAWGSVTFLDVSVPPTWWGNGFKNRLNRSGCVPWQGRAWSKGALSADCLRCRRGLSAFSDAPLRRSADPCTLVGGSLRLGFGTSPRRPVRGRSDRVFDWRHALKRHRSTASP